MYHIGHIRRTDWLPVGHDPRGGEQEHLGALSESDIEEEPCSDDSDTSGTQRSDDHEGSVVESLPDDSDGADEDNVLHGTFVTDWHSAGCQDVLGLFPEEM